MSKPNGRDSRSLAQALHGLQTAAVNAAIREATTLVTNLVDPEDALYDPETGTIWDALGTGAVGASDTPLDTEEKHKSARKVSRDLCATNQYAINGVENRISYIVGPGHEYTAIPKKGVEPPEALIDRVQAILDAFVEENHWHARQQEIMRRKDRDGECFLRISPAPKGSEAGLVVRFVEPGQVYRPSSVQDEAAMFGVRTKPDDVETVLGYYIDGEYVKVRDIQHRKLGVDFNVKRGTPLYYPVQRNLRRCERLLQVMTTTCQMQAAIGLIRKHQGGTSSDIQNWVQDEADVSVVNNTARTTSYYKRYAPGTVLDVPATVEYEFPGMTLDASRIVTVLQAELRGIASRLVMPEFMLSSDASNANYSSTMVAEGPAVKMFQRLQWTMIHEDTDLLWKAIEGQEGIPEDVRQLIEIDVEPPRIETRDRKADVEANVALVNAKIMSKRTARIRDNLDPDAEEEQIDKEREESMESNPFAGMMPNGFGQNGLPGGQGADDRRDDNEDEDEE